MFKLLNRMLLSLPDLIAEALRKNDYMPTFVIDVSNIIHASLHANDMDLVLRSSWKGFEQCVENILKIHARWFATLSYIIYC